MDMSMAAWPSIDPAIPRSACSRASRSSRSRSVSRNSTAITTIMTGPPVNSARVNCQPMSRARITPNSITRLVEAISNAIAAVKLAPLRNRDRASATAAYEHDEDAAPKPVARTSVRGRSSPRRRMTVDFLTRACTIADSVNPRISAQVICHVIDPVMDSACSTAWVSLTSQTSPGSEAILYPVGVYGMVSPPGLSRRPRRLACVSTGKASGDPAAPAVELHGLVKRYGQIAAVDGLSLTAARGAVTGILGPNGAGKTTTIEICEGYRRPDQGTVRVLGWDPARDARALRPRVGVMLQSGGIPPAVPAADYLRLLSRFHAHPVDPAALLDLVGLTSVARIPYKRLSGGQQQRLSLAAAVIGRPELVFLDEPTAGMDPQARHATWDLIARLRSEGVSVILTTHFMEEAERLCDHVAIIDHGQLVAAGTPAELTGTVGQLRFRAEAGLDIDSLLTVLPPACAVKESPAGHYVIEAHGAVDPLLLAAVTAWCAERGVLANSLRIESRTLEDVFLELTGRDLRT